MAAPVIHVQAQPLTVYEGQTASFIVVAGGVGLTYQWQQSTDSGANWTNISGATLKKYNHPATSRSTDNGKQVRPIVNGSGGSTTGTAATLTVWNPTALGSNYVWFDPSAGIYTERTGASATTPTTDGNPVGTWRDQGGTINGTAPADAQRPTYRATGLNGTPSIQFVRGSTTLLDFTTALSAFFQNKSYGYMFAAVRPTAEAFTHSLLTFSNNAGSARATIQLNPSTTSGQAMVAGRRLDADAGAQTTNTATFIDSEVLIVGGEFLWASSDAHLRRNKVRHVSNTTWQTDGATSNTASSFVGFGAGTAAGAQPASVYMGHVVLCNPAAALSDATIALIEGFIEYKSNLPSIDWNNNTRSTGVMSSATVKATTVAQSPSGAAITEGALTSWRYRHPNQLGYHWGRLHAAYDSSGTNEQGGGGKSVYQYSDDRGLTWSSPVELIPSQSTWTSGANSYAVGVRFTTARRWVKYDGRLFFACCVIQSDGDVLNDNGITCVAVACVEVFSDGTKGTPFRITPEDYTAIDGKTKLNYDSTLGPALLPTVSIYGRFGGTATGYSGVALEGIIYQDGIAYFEKHTARGSDTDPDILVRTIRDLTGGTARTFYMGSSDGGTTWSRIVNTTVPAGPSPCEIVRLTDGSYAIIGNMDSNRTEMFMALLDGTSRKVTSLRYVRTGVSATPDYAGTYKFGGAAYPSAVQIGNYLHILYSTQKEDIVHSRVLITGLTDNGNDANTIAVTSPAADDTRTNGTAANITGTQSGTSGNVDILLSLDGGLTFPITLASNTTLPYSWTPSYGHISSTCVLRVRDTADTNVFGDSLEFTVQDAPSSGGAANLLLMTKVG